MSTTTEHHAASSSTRLELTPVLSARCALTWPQLAVCGLFCAFFMYLNYIPLFFSDIWCHVHYGKWALEHGHFPQEDPFMPLAAGMHTANNAWLGQLLFALVESWGGGQFVSNLFALTVLATYVIYCRAFFELTRRLSLAVLGTGMVLFIGWSRHAIVRPEIFGGLCFALLVWMVVQGEPWRSRRPKLGEETMPDRLPWAVWLGVPIVFAVWANLHGSFMTGLAVLGCHALGRVIEVAWRSRSFSAVLADRWVRRWALLTELAFAATLLNPAGIDLLIETLRFGKNPNLRDVLEWYPLQATMIEAIQFALTIILMLVLLRHSRVRMTPADVLLLLVFGLAVGPTIRMIGWWAPVFTLAMLPHAAAIVQRLRSAKFAWPRAGGMEERTKDAKLTPAHFLPSLICLLVVWAAFALSPISQNLLSDKPRELEQVVAKGTPLGVTAWLRENPPEGIVFGPQWWSDWLCWDGPKDLQVFVTSHIHLVPQRVWRDYMRVARGEEGWSATLDRYGAKTLVVDKELQRGFTRKVQRSTQWRTVYEDERAMILQRRAQAPANASHSDEPNAGPSGVAAQTAAAPLESSP